MKLFTADFFTQLIITVLLMGVVVFFIQKHFENKWAAVVAEKVLTRQNFTNSKKDTYLQSIDITIRHIVSHYSTTPNSKILTTAPTQLEMNSCMIQLYLYANDAKIAEQLKKILLPLKKDEDIVVEASKLFNMIGRDLGNENLNIDYKELQFIYPQIKDSSASLK